MDLKILLIVLSIIIVIVLMIVIMNYVTVYPKIYYRRFVNGQKKKRVKVGDFATDVNRVEIKRTILVEDDDIYNPVLSTQLTLYGLKNVKTPQPLIFFIHDGGWTTSDESDLSEYMKLLASNGCLVAGANYALAPVHTYPTSTQQLMMSLNHLYLNAEKYHIDANNMFIFGCGAGAHLAAQLGVILSNKDYAYQLDLKPIFPLEKIKGLLLYNGIYDLENVDDLKVSHLHDDLWAYTGHKDYRSYDRLDELSPLKHVLKGYPKSFVMATYKENLNLQSDALIQKFDEQEITYQALLWDNKPDLEYDFIFDLNTEESQRVYKEVVAFIQEETKNIKKGQS